MNLIKQVLVDLIIGSSTCIISSINGIMLKQLKTASKLPVEIFGTPQDYNNLHLPKTQEVIGRLISFGIRCTWTEDEV